MRSIINSIFFGALGAGASLFSSPAFAQGQAKAEEPSYSAERCCSVCPKAADRDAYVSEYMRGYRVVVEGKDGWLFRTEAELQWLEPNDPELWLSLKRLIAALKARGTQVMMFPQPPRGLVETRMLKDETLQKFDINELQRRYSGLVDQLRAVGVLVVDGSVFSHNSGEQYFYKRDGHWKASGSRRAAELIAAQVKEAGFSFTPKQFETSQTGLVGSRGTMTHVVSTLCGLMYPAEFGPAYQTRAPATDDLFGDEAAPEVALVGTSFSATPTYNFLGFLRTALNTDVYQAAMAGGGFDGALSQYLASALYQQNPPKLIIWEFPYQQLQRTNTAVMRRVLPLVGNGCAGRKPLLSNTVKLAGNNDLVEVIVNGGAQFTPVPAKDLWLDFQFSDPNVRVMKAEVWYADGKSQILNGRYNSYTKMNGRFALETNYSPEAEVQPIVSIRVQSVSETANDTTVTATVCKRT